MALDVAALPGGDCIVVGAFTGTVTFGNGEPTQTTLSAGNTMDAFFARFASDGDLVWVKQAQNIQGEVLPYTVSAYDDGTFVAGGYFTIRTVFGPGRRPRTRSGCRGAGPCSWRKFRRGPAA